MGRLFVVGAPSGTGKTTLLRMLLERVPGFRFSVSHTTRARRAAEREGIDYHFASRAEFQQRVAGGEFLEWAQVYDEFYGTHHSELDRAAKDGIDLVLDIDIQGARSVRRLVADAVLVLILPPSWDALEKRLRGRGSEDETAIARRLAKAREQLLDWKLYNYVVINEDLDQAFRGLESVVLAERQRVDVRDPSPALRRLIEGGHA